MHAPAAGIHDHATKKLGRRVPTGAPRLRLANFLRAGVPAHPSRCDHATHAGLTFGLYGNDKVGDCGPTMVANARRLTTSWLTGTMQAPSLEDVYDLYRRSGNPKFDPTTDADDNGVSLQTMLDAVHDGGIGGVKCVAFASVDVARPDELRAAVAIFGCVLYGVTLEIAQQHQQVVWSYRRSTVWGGHAVLGSSYDEAHLGIESWAEHYAMTKAFSSHQLDEAWIAIWPEHFGAAHFLKGVDVDALARDYEALTCRPLARP